MRQYRNKTVFCGNRFIQLFVSIINDLLILPIFQKQPQNFSNRTQQIDILRAPFSFFKNIIKTDISKPFSLNENRNDQHRFDVLFLKDTPLAFRKCFYDSFNNVILRKQFHPPLKTGIPVNHMLKLRVVDLRFYALRTHLIGLFECQFILLIDEILKNIHPGTIGSGYLCKGRLEAKAGGRKAASGKVRGRPFPA